MGNTEYGIKIIETHSTVESAIAIVSIYQNSQKPEEEHKTFKQYLNSPASWHPNPQIQSCMNLMGAGLGEKTATMLVERFKSVHGIVNATEAELLALPGFGKASVAKLFKAIGR